MNNKKPSNKLTRTIDYFNKLDTLYNKQQFIKTAATGHGYFKVGQKKIRVDSQSSFHAFIKIFIQKEYDLELSFTPEIIVDAGSNVGYASIFFRNKYPKSKIIAIEPEECNYRTLKENLKGYNDIIPRKEGLWYKDAFLKIENSDASDNLSFRVIESSIQDSEAIKAISIPSLIKNYDLQRIDLLKIDIEGAEYELFTRNYDSWMKKVKVIVVELHENIHNDVHRIAHRRAKDFSFSTVEKGENLILYQKNTLKNI